MRRAIVLISTVWLLCSCQVSPPRLQDGWVALGNGQYQLQDLWPLPAQQLLQQVHWDDGSNRQQVLLHVYLSAEEQILVAMSPVGQELWRLRYAPGHQLAVAGIEPFNHPYFAARILAEMQLALLPAAELKPRLRRLQLRESEAKWRELINAAQKPVLKIAQPEQFQAGQTILIESEHYHLQISTLSQDWLP